MWRQAEGDPNRFARQLFDGLPDRYDRLAELLSLGQNRRWRRAMVDHVVAGATRTSSTSAHPVASDPGRRLILDVASGTAGVAIQLARRTQGAVVGVDLTEPMLRRGADALTRASLGDGAVALTVARAEQLPVADGTFDGLTFTYLLRYVGDVDATVAELARVVKSGAPVASLDFAVPGNRFWWAWWWGYTRLVLPAAGALTGGRHWYDVGRFLGPNISGFYRRHPVPAVVRAWEAAGFVDVRVRPMSLGGGLIMTGRRGGG